MNNSYRQSLASAVFAAGLIFTLHGASADESPLNLPVHVVHNFVGNSSPTDSMVKGPDGSLYGVTQVGGGGAYQGTFYRLTTDGAFAVLARFDDQTGKAPTPRLVLGPDGAFYGTTIHGGANRSGTVFKVTTAGILTPLVSFNNPSGASPSSLVLGPDGNFYGTSITGTSYPGTVFKVTSDGTLTIIASFPADKKLSPGRLALGADGAFYGEMFFASGTLVKAFRVTTDGQLKMLGGLGGTVWLSNEGLTLATDGNLYGVTWGSSSLTNPGTLFRVTPDGAATTLKYFTWAQGALPTGGLTLGNDGDLYGTTVYGGTFEGTVFKITTAGKMTTLANFTARSTGVRPYSGVTFGAEGSLYGTTVTGGPKDGGTIFRVDLPPAISQPADRTNAVGTTATFSVGATGTAPLNYQWHKDGTRLADGPNVSGASSATLTIPGVRVSDAGGYTVTVANNLGSVTSSAAVLAVVLVDSDKDGVSDDKDLCPNTRPGAVVDRHGCSIEQLAPCAGPPTGGTWQSHGQYLLAVVKATNAFYAAGLITKIEKNAIQLAAIKSPCGRKQIPR